MKVFTTIFTALLGSPIVAISVIKPPWNKLSSFGAKLMQSPRALMILEATIGSSNFVNSVLVEQNEMGMKTNIKWDSRMTGFTAFCNGTRPMKRIKVKQYLTNSFLPSGDFSPDYYKYTAWRMAQRFVCAISAVFGTQALLLALGFKKTSIGKN